MCVAAYFTLGSREMRVFFSQNNAQLPVAMSGGIQLIAWGRRIKQQGQLPIGGTAFRSAILAGNWDRHSPKAVRLWIKSFCETDVEGKQHWHEVTSGKWVKGLLATCRNEQRVYIVTIEPVIADTPYERWPDIGSG